MSGKSAKLKPYGQAYCRHCGRLHKFCECEWILRVVTVVVKFLRWGAK